MAPLSSLVGNGAHPALEPRGALAELLDALPDGVFLVDREARVVHWSRGMEELTGFSADEVRGRPCAVLEGDRCFFGPNDESGLPPCALFQEGAVTRRRCRIRRRDGTWVQVVKSARLLRDEQGRAVGGIESVTDITERVGLEEELERLRRAPGVQEPGFHGMIGRDPSMLRLFDLLATAGRTDATVLIEGETGCGKERVAEAVHRMSRRVGRPFLRVCCAALSEGLLESELFGHVRGAFTGEVSTRTGRFEAADGGTLFLDEIGDVSLDFQKKLLRVLEQQEFEKVGSNRPVRVDVRILAATNRDLLAMTRDGRFRADLYYRLAVVPVRVPALRERIEDLPLLADHLLGVVAAREKRPVPPISPAAMAVLCAWGWPGNVRELEHALAYAMVLSRGRAIDASHLPPAIQAGTRREEISEPKRRGRPTAEEIRQALRAEDGRRERAAARLGVTRMALWKWMRDLGVVWPP